MRNLRRNIKMATTTMRSNRGRSYLTILGVVIAVAAVTIVASVGRGIQASVAQQANQYGKNVITVRPADVSNGTSALGGSAPRTTLTDKDIERIDRLQSVEATVPLAVAASSAVGDNKIRTVVFGANSNLHEVLNQELAYGAFFTTKEESNSVAVLGADAAEALFDQKVPLGRSFDINGQQFIVSGTLSRFVTSPFASSTNLNNAIFISPSGLAALAPNGATTFELLVKVRSEDQIKSADAAITSLLARSHGNSDDFQVLSPNELTSDTSETFDLLRTFVLIAALITLLVSGVGIMNVMLVSVTERIHEIGIRKAVGATNKQILDQFVTEAAILSISGSVVGAALAFITVWLLRTFTALQPSYDWRVAGLACVVACVFGIVFGTVPAIKAARKDPIAALRSE